MFRKKHGQSTIEYTTTIVIIIAVLISMGAYFKRGMQGRWKAAVDDIGDQYDPRLANTNITHRVAGNTQTQVITLDTVYAGVNGVWTMRYDQSNMVETRVGNSRISSSN